MSPAESLRPKAGARDEPSGGSSTALERLRALLAAEGGLVASLLSEEEDGEPVRANGSSGIAQLAASGPRAEGRREQYELLIETIYEGYLLHYHAPRVLQVSEQDLGLLAGDRLYALGLARLVKLGDIEAVAELADVITLSALAQSAGNTELADAVWAAGAHAIGWGATAPHERAKALIRAGSPEALDAMRGVSAPESPAGES